MKLCLMILLVISLSERKKYTDLKFFQHSDARAGPEEHDKFATFCESAPGCIIDAISMWQKMKEISFKFHEHRFLGFEFRSTIYYDCVDKRICVV